MRVNIIVGDRSSIIALFLFDAMSAVCWFIPKAHTIGAAGGFVMMPIMLIALGPLLVVHVRRRLATVRLLRAGFVAYATLRDRVEIQSAVGYDRPAIDRLRFTFEHRGRTYQVTTDATDEEARSIVDDAREQIVFQPGKQLRVAIIDALPGRPRIREDQTIDPRNHVLGGLTAIVFLGAAVAINAAGALLWLR